MQEVERPAGLDERERLLTFREAAEALNLPYFKIQRAARRGLIPTYSILNGRRYVTLRDILERLLKIPVLQSSD